MKTGAALYLRFRLGRGNDPVEGSRIIAERIAAHPEDSLRRATIRRSLRRITRRHDRRAA